jgi:hypothetical protein
VGIARGFFHGGQKPVPSVHRGFMRGWQDCGRNVRSRTSRKVTICYKGYGILTKG